MPDWTTEQEQVIQSRDQNLLVAAAAGSGKTAVLVERIIRMLTEPGSTLDIDRLLVVTYTNAAAAEMKDKILRALEQASAERPEDAHLASQLTRIHSASISTIHSFCLSVIRSHFQELDLDPSFRTGDEGELKLLQKDAAEELIEEVYDYLAKKERPEWLGADTDPEEAVRSIETGRSDTALAEALLQIHAFAVSFESEETWLHTCRSMYDDTGDTSAWRSRLKERLLQEITDTIDGFEHLKKINEEQNGPVKYTAALEADIAGMEEIRSTLPGASIQKIGELLHAVKSEEFPRIYAKREPAYDEQTKKLVADRRKTLYAKLGSLCRDYFYGTEEEIEADLKQSGNTIRVLIDMTLEFMRRYAEVKRKRNLIDYSDMEHFALDILTVIKDGVRVPSAAAQEYRDFFREVIIDEYQDSSFIQEALLAAVSGTSVGRNNRFMVGDVKQSIYGFRQSRPEIFQEKYEHYAQEDTIGCARINLTRNFRSDERILTCANDVFRHLMRKEVGGVDYTSEQELVYGRGSFLPAVRKMPPTEVLLLNTGSTAIGEVEGSEREQEFIMIADRIRQMVNDPEEQILDAGTGKMRRIRYGDIVILLRSMKNRAETGVRILTERGIPAYTESRSGYFQADEIRAILDYLRILDNPRQDIAMASVLHSPMGGFSSDDMAAIRAAYPDESFAMAVLRYSEEDTCIEEADRQERLRRFLDRARTHRKAILYTPLHQLIRQILADTGYGVYLTAMQGAARRTANVEMLIQRARNYEEISYKGIFHFLRYLDELQDKEVDFGEANVAEENDSVRIMSSHKSKGLEFPVVFVAELGSSLKGGSRDNLVMHATCGMGINSLDTKNRIKSSTICRTLILKEKEYEEIGEEIRILYVAMTRAREKMILTGRGTKITEKLTTWKNNRWDGERLSVGDIMEAGTGLDLLMPAILREEQDFEVRQIEPADLVNTEISAMTKELLTEDFLKNLDTECVYDEALLAALQAAKSYRYPYEKTLGYAAKVSVSELKMQRIQEEMDGQSPFEEPEPVPLIPKFLKEEEVHGTQRGTAYHRFLECFDYTTYDTTEADVCLALQEQEAQGVLPSDMAELIRPGAMAMFLASPIGMRMRQAAVSGRLHREQMFMLGIPGSEIYGEHAGEETYLLQGIVDAYFEEDGELILVDYKTDRVENGEELRKRYALQLEYYAQALERLAGMPVREKLMYSFALRDVIPV